MPAFGLRQSQLSIAACGQKKIASMSAPTCCALVCSFWWIAFRVVHVEQFARDARLVRRDHHAVAGLVQAGDRFERAGNRNPLGRAT